MVNGNTFTIISFPRKLISDFFLQANLQLQYTLRPCENYFINLNIYIYISSAIKHRQIVSCVLNTHTNHL